MDCLPATQLSNTHHRTTWSSRIWDNQSPGKTRPIYAQIDYILCRQSSKCLLEDSRSYSGATLFSDHRLVVAHLNLKNMHLTSKQSSKKHWPFDVQKLLSSKTTQDRYKTNLTKQIQSITGGLEPNQRLEKLMSSIRSSAVSEIDFRPQNSKPNSTNDETICYLSSQHKKLLMDIQDRNEGRDISKLKKERNSLRDNICKRQREIETIKAEHLIQEITDTDDSRRMFNAVPEIRTKNKPHPVCVKDKNGEFIVTDGWKAHRIAEWFADHFTDDEGAIESFVSDPSPLTQRITENEVERAVKPLKNGRARGPDQIDNELLKFAEKQFFKQYAEIIIDALENHHQIDSIGQGILKALPKPKKTPRPPEHLRPIILLNGARKLLSIITLKRIEKKIDTFTGPCQAGFKDVVAQTVFGLSECLLPW